MILNLLILILLDNIKTNFENKLPNINSLNTCLKLNLDILASNKINYFKLEIINHVLIVLH